MATRCKLVMWIVCVPASWFCYFYSVHTAAQSKASTCQLQLFPVWTAMKGRIKQSGWMMHPAHWSMQRHMGPKYRMQTSPASHYPGELSTAQDPCQTFFFFSSPCFTFTPISTTATKLKHTRNWHSHKNRLWPTVTHTYRPHFLSPMQLQHLL